MAEYATVHVDDFHDTVSIAERNYDFQYPVRQAGAVVGQLDSTIVSTILSVECISPIQFSDPELSIAERNFDTRFPVEFYTPEVEQFNTKMSIAAFNFDTRFPVAFNTAEVDQDQNVIFTTILSLVCISPIQFSDPELSIAERNFDTRMPVEFNTFDTNIYSYGTDEKIIEKTGIMIAPNILI